MIRSGILAAGVAVLLWSPGAKAASDAQSGAASDAARIAELTARVEALTARLEALEAAAAAGAPATPVAHVAPTAPAGRASVPEWVERIAVKGDFRYRHDTVQEEGMDDRHRQRIRARTAVIAQVSEDVEVGFGLASGGEDPGSANETLGNGFSKKGVGLDLAYAHWATPVDGLAIVGGKFRNPFYRPAGEQLIWDGDVNPEGLAVTWAQGPVFANAMGLWLNEAAGGDDVYVFGLQGGVDFALGDRTRMVVGTSYYDLGGLEGIEVLFDGDPRGNSVDANNRYVQGYEELELFAELQVQLGSGALMLWADYADNAAADEYDQGFSIGTAWAATHRGRPWDIGYAYRDVEADAVFALLTDSDFLGGGTDARGHIIQGSYDLTSRIALGGTLFLGRRDGNLGDAHDYDRLTLDVSFRY